MTEIDGIDGGALCERPDGAWAPHKPPMAELPALRGLRKSREEAMDTVARVVETHRLRGPAEGVRRKHIAGPGADRARAPERVREGREEP